MIAGQITLADMLEVNSKYKPKPAWVIVPRGYVWCPYCNWVYKLNKDSYLGVEKCSNCGISTKDYFVKKFNGLGEFNEILIKSKCEL